MTDRAAFNVACCTDCGALADVEKDIVSYKQRDIERCKHPPIEACPEMRAAIEDAKPKTVGP